MSSKMEKKQKGLKLRMKREKRHGHKRKRRNGLDDKDTDSEDENDKGYMPTPSQLAAIELGQNVISLKKQKKKKEYSNSQISISAESMPVPDFTQGRPFVKIFWTGPPGEDPVSSELKEVRKSYGILPKGPLSLCPPPVLLPSSPGLPKCFSEIFTAMSLKTPSAVQMQCWPCILCGANVLCIAPTGSGKTYGYSLPMIPHISAQLVKMKHASVPAPIALVLVPTRELALQVSAALKPFKKVCDIRSAPIYGGQDRDIQLQHLTQFGYTHIIIATPGRLLDLVATKQVSLSRVSYLVLDEADRMLSLGFEKQLDLISSQIRPDRQSSLFSATFPGRLREAAERWICNAVVIRVSTMELHDNNRHIIAPPQEAEEEKNEEEDIVNDSDNDEDVCISLSEKNMIDQDSNTHQDSVQHKTINKTDREMSSITISRSITQHVHVCASHKKPRLLMRFIEKIRGNEKLEHVRQPGSMLIFCTKIKSVKFVVEFLKKQNIPVQELHGQLNQRQREQRLSDFKAGKLSTLCATDVAARGIHIKRLKYVVNYDFPSSLEQYCHRVGRAGRQGEAGETYSLFTRNMAPLIDDLIKLLESCNQIVEPNLIKLSQEFNSGNFDETELENDTLVSENESE